MARFDLSKGIRTSKRTGTKRADGAAFSAADKSRPDENAELSMSVSGICGEPGKLYAFVRFEDGARYCEYRFPDVVLTVSDGFTEDELVQLKFYVAGHVAELKKMAAAIDPISAMLQ